MKLSLCLLIFFAFQTLSGISQTIHHRVVSDAVSRKGIPYATIKVLNKPEGTYADSLGRFEVKASANDSLLVTCVGYQSEILVPLGDTIFLHPIIVNLAEISVKTKKTKEYSVGLVDTKKEGVLFYCGHVNIEHSVIIKIPDSFTFYRIKGVKFKTNHENGIALVRLHLYSQGEDGMPDEELLPEDVLLNNHLKSNGQIDLSRFNLILNNHVLFVGIEEVLSSTNLNFHKGECIGFGYTLEVNEPQTYSRTLRDPAYQWRLDKTPWLKSNKNSNSPNLMVSLIID